MARTRTNDELVRVGARPALSRLAGVSLAQPASAQLNEIKRVLSGPGRDADIVPCGRLRIIQRPESGDGMSCACVLRFQQRAGKDGQWTTAMENKEGLNVQWLKTERRVGSDSDTDEHDLPLTCNSQTRRYNGHNGDNPLDIRSRSPASTALQSKTSLLVQPPRDGGDRLVAAHGISMQLNAAGKSRQVMCGAGVFRLLSRRAEVFEIDSWVASSSAAPPRPPANSTSSPLSTSGITVVPPLSLPSSTYGLIRLFPRRSRLLRVDPAAAAVAVQRHPQRLPGGASKPGTIVSVAAEVGAVVVSEVVVESLVHIYIMSLQYSC
ncbi:hypothetical protein C8R45DRAFT_937636 [Mycena sanguinolenta]|nr:hypothetical protein C8R45DRAFT_937636 [Mycena sanguinolenta]